MYNLRRFISLSLTLSFLMMTFTGVILFIAPKGRVANWTNWDIFGLNKTQYENLHITFSLLFFTLMVFHIYLNWKPLIAYLKNKSRAFSLLNKELILALVLNFFFFIGTLNYYPAFEEFLDFHDDVKSSWEKKSSTRAPYGHAELSTLEEFTEQTGMNLENLMRKFDAKNIKGASKEKTIEEIAKENSISPEQLFELIKTKNITKIKQGDEQ
ncbi:MAG: DUF4405 domain-containing protein [Sulfurospirillaceae bacterium]|nr:DUF4405 domain-containing protein [Sulfurospirillaceae bacterium]